MQAQISRRVYELYLERGEQSDPNQNWLDAEFAADIVFSRHKTAMNRDAPHAREDEARFL
jgi:hypothetical protein